MLLILALLILVTSLLVFFSQEFAGIYRKITIIPGARLVIPLLIASWLVEQYESIFTWTLLQLKQGFHIELQMITSWLSLPKSIALIMQLFLLVSVPYWIIGVLEKRKPMYGYDRETSRHRAGLFFWVVAVCILSVYQP